MEIKINLDFEKWEKDIKSSYNVEKISFSYEFKISMDNAFNFKHKSTVLESVSICIPYKLLP